ARRPAPRPAAPAAPAPAPSATLATLTVESDVPGASVFLDREYIGETPVTVPNLPPGARQLNVSATGFEAIARSVTLEAGAQTVSMRFKEVRLDQRMPVVHRHGMGSCEGQLIGTLDGLRYETANRNDGFTLAYDALETFEINYLDKNLRVKQRGGRTWNFTERNAENADALFVFHREVMAARDKLAKGYAPVQ
ncbi:MAG: PEGA domain-containing protein, partial [Vicinamibacterales bacterium]|nr:PEGA domain-containing protein [Vicinamibacterales bacterium]